MLPSAARRTFGASASAPTASSTSAVPMVGWPAKGSSDPGVKMRTAQVTSGRSGGKTKVVSLRFSSRAIACIVAVASSATRGKTASGLPPNGRSVNTSAMMKSTGRGMGVRPLLRTSSRRGAGEGKRACGLGRNAAGGAVQPRAPNQILSGFRKPFGAYV